MKPLALEWFRKHEMLDAYYVGGSYVPHAIVGRDKRFSDAELLAEYWKVTRGLCDGRGKKARDRRATLERFAIHAHHDE